MKLAERLARTRAFVGSRSKSSVEIRSASS